MAIERKVSIDAMVVSIGQRDQAEPWTGKLEVVPHSNGKVELAHRTQSGFQSIVFSVRDLEYALSATAQPVT